MVGVHFMIVKVLNKPYRIWKTAYHQLARKARKKIVVESMTLQWRSMNKISRILGAVASLQMGGCEAYLIFNYIYNLSL